MVFNPNLTLQEEEVRMVSVKGEEVPIKDIHVQDATGTAKHAKVTLWRESTEIKARVGDYVNITNLVVNAYNNIVSLSGTGSTTVEVNDYIHTLFYLKSLSKC